MDQTAVNVGIISSFIIPSEAVWRRVAYEMTSAIMRSLGIAAGPFGALLVPNTLMMFYAAIYALIMLAIGIRQFNHRDL